MRNKLVKDLSASSAQVILNQVLGLLVFVITSRYLDKAVYGEFNWSLAVLTFSTTLLSLRLEQIIVKKIASGEDASKMLSVFCGHVFLSGILFYLILLTGSFIFPSFFTDHSLLLLLAVGQLMSFFSMPFKQLATGKEKFGWLAVMSSVSNVVRAGWLFFVALFGSLTIQQVIVVYIASSVIEFLLCVFLVHKRLQVRIVKWNPKAYAALLGESVPQIGVVFLNACIARIDWILLGVFSTQVITAEYSFAYKVFELSPIPLLIIGPVLLTRFSGWFGKNADTDLAEKQKKIRFLIRMEMIAATFFPLLLNIAWSPLMDALTQGKYGKVNETVFLLLSACIPFQYLINVFWTVNFAQDRLKMIFKITLVTALIIVCGDLVMIPLFHAKGAAIIYLFAMMVECVLYADKISIISSRDKWKPLLTCIFIAFVSGVSVQIIQMPIIFKIIQASVIYIALLAASKQICKEDFSFIRNKFFPIAVKYKTV